MSGPGGWLAVRRAVPPADPLAVLAAAPPGDRFLLERPSRGQAVVGIGAAARIREAGPDRFPRAARAVAHLLAAAEVRGDAASPSAGSAGPLAVGGFAFDDGAPRGAGPTCVPDPDWRGFGRADWVLPELLWVQRGGRAWVTAVAPRDAGGDAATLEGDLDARLDAWRRRIARAPEAGDPPLDPAGLRAAPDAPRADYVARVARALRAIAAGDLEKVVVARSVSVARPGGFDPVAILRALRATHPSCAPFLVTRGDAAFVGASPERLVRRAGLRVDTAAVAGTAARGRSPAEDRALARTLVESKKEQDEHAVVVRFLRDRLAPFCTELAIPEAPDLLRLEAIQHLHTPVRGRAAPGFPSLLELAGALHPTPASGGAPQAEAVAWLAAHEGLDRGWYAGPLGFVDAAGDGELWVALRSALLRGEAARLYAGAGVVAGSDPGAELRETRLKLGTLLAPLLEL